MALNKPYYRIFRPGIKHNAFDNSTGGYERDIMFLPEAERRSMIMAARLIMDDFEHLFECIEPHTINENVFSHRIYELLLRTCTEVESCCKGILVANGHTANSMEDYKKKDYFDYTVENGTLEQDLLNHGWRKLKSGKVSEPTPASLLRRSQLKKVLGKREFSKYSIPVLL